MSYAASIYGGIPGYVHRVHGRSEGIDDFHKYGICHHVGKRSFSTPLVTSEGDDLYAVVIEVVGIYSPVKAVICRNPIGDEVALSIAKVHPFRYRAVSVIRIYVTVHVGYTLCHVYIAGEGSGFVKREGIGFSTFHLIVQSAVDGEVRNDGAIVEVYGDDGFAGACGGILSIHMAAYGFYLVITGGQAINIPGHAVFALVLIHESFMYEGPLISGQICADQIPGIRHSIEPIEFNAIGRDIGLMCKICIEIQGLAYVGIGFTLVGTHHFSYLRSGKVPIYIVDAIGVFITRNERILIYVVDIVGHNHDLGGVGNAVGKSEEISHGQLGTVAKQVCSGYIHVHHDIQFTIQDVLSEVSFRSPAEIDPAVCFIHSIGAYYVCSVLVSEGSGEGVICGESDEISVVYSEIDRSVVWRDFIEVRGGGNCQVGRSLIVDVEHVIGAGIAGIFAEFPDVICKVANYHFQTIYIVRKSSQVGSGNEEGVGSFGKLVIISGHVQSNRAIGIDELNSYSGYIFKVVEVVSELNFKIFGLIDYQFTFIFVHECYYVG
ncbi:hypothetical protein DSECCO2_628070 [anaerobic digester metagenome]